jgi:calcineurin-like phosphoesterase family protein
MAIFVISDTHFNHAKIIELCNRPFKDSEEMTESLIKNWNDTVNSNDEIYHLGDFSWFKDHEDAINVFARLKGKKHLIIGNHDYHDVRNNLSWESVNQYKELNYNKRQFVLFHYPIYDWVGKHTGSIHVHGHIHNNVTNIKNAFNVSVENIGYKPISIDKILEMCS